MTGPTAEADVRRNRRANQSRPLLSFTRVDRRQRRVCGPTTASESSLFMLPTLRLNRIRQHVVGADIQFENSTTSSSRAARVLMRRRLRSTARRAAERRVSNGAPVGSGNKAAAMISSVCATAGWPIAASVDSINGPGATPASATRRVCQRPPCTAPAAAADAVANSFASRGATFSNAIANVVNGMCRRTRTSSRPIADSASEREDASRNISTKGTWRTPDAPYSSARACRTISTGAKSDGCPAWQAPGIKAPG